MSDRVCGECVWYQPNAETPAVRECRGWGLQSHPVCVAQGCGCRVEWVERYPTPRPETPGCRVWESGEEES